jgi:hypothetical protein
MVTISDLPVDDPVVARVLQSMWLGAVKIKPDTVLNADMINKQITMFKTADVSNSWEAESVARTIQDLKRILTYLE